MNPEKYMLGDISFFNIRNKNELRIINRMPAILAEFTDFVPDPLQLEDIYALALNMLPARYTQQHSFVIRESVSPEMVDHAIREAALKVRSSPKLV
jgi:hypothetical protein